MRNQSKMAEFYAFAGVVVDARWTPTDDEVIAFQTAMASVLAGLPDVDLFITMHVDTDLCRLVLGKRQDDNFDPAFPVINLGENQEAFRVQLDHARNETISGLNQLGCEEISVTEALYIFSRDEGEVLVPGLYNAEPLGEVSYH